MDPSIAAHVNCSWCVRITQVTHARAPLDDSTGIQLLDSEQAIKTIATANIDSAVLVCGDGGRDINADGGMSGDSAPQLLACRSVLNNVAVADRDNIAGTIKANTRSGRAGRQQNVITDA